MWKLWGILNGDYSKFREALKDADIDECGLPSSLMSWAKAKRLSIKYGWEIK